MQECLYKLDARVPLLMAVLTGYVYLTAPLHVPNFKRPISPRVRRISRTIALRQLITAITSNDGHSQTGGGTLSVGK